MPQGGLNKMTCGLSQGLQDISSAFTSVKDKLNEKISAGVPSPADGKGIGANISTMKADMDAAMTELKAKLDVVIPEVSAQLPNLQTAAEEAAAKLKAAAAEINPARIQQLQSEAATKFDEIRSKWGSVNTPGVNIEQVISDVENNFATIDFCTECPNVDLVDTGKVDEGTGIPIYDTVKKGITAEQPTEDSAKPKDPVDKKKEEEVVPAKVPAGDDNKPIKTAITTPNPKPEPTTVPSETNMTFLLPKTKIDGAPPDLSGSEKLHIAGIEVESIFVPDSRTIGGKTYNYWRPQNYMSQLEYEKFFTKHVAQRRRSLTAMIRGRQKRLAKDPNNESIKKHIAKMQDKLEVMQQIRTLPYTGNQYGVYGKQAELKFVKGYQDKWQGTDCPKVLNDQTRGFKTIGPPLFWLGYEYITEGNVSKSRPVWNYKTEQWDWAAGGGGLGEETHHANDGEG